MGRGEMVGTSSGSIDTPFHLHISRGHAYQRWYGGHKFVCVYRDVGLMPNIENENFVYPQTLLEDDIDIRIKLNHVNYVKEKLN